MKSVSAKTLVFGLIIVIVAIIASGVLPLNQRMQIAIFPLIQRR